MSTFTEDEPARPAGLVGWVRHLAADVTPLQQSPQFRRLFIGETLSVIGTQMTAVAVPVQVFGLTHSSFDVGLLGLAAVVPLIVFGLFGGAVADAVDRRRLVVLTSSGLTVVSGVLVLQAVLQWKQLWLLYVVVALQASLFALDNPARSTFAPRLLPLHQMAAVAALRQIGFNIGLTLGPMVAGALVGLFDTAHQGTTGVGLVYAIDTVSFAATIYAVSRLDAMRPEGGGTKAGLRSVLDGFGYLRSQPVVLMTFAVDINAMVFGMPRALFPALALSQFHGGPGTVGLLYSSVAIGALVAAGVSGPLMRVRRQGWAVIWSIVLWGAAIGGFGLVHSLWLGLLLLGAAGAADAVSAVYRSAILQVATPDEMRGRLSGVFLVVVAGGPRVGDLEAGAAAALVSPTFSVVSGGVACIAGVLLLAAAVPSFRRYDARVPLLPPPPAAGDVR